MFPYNKKREGEPSLSDNLVANCAQQRSNQMCMARNHPLRLTLLISITSIIAFCAIRSVQVASPYNDGQYFPKKSTIHLVNFYICQYLHFSTP